MKVVSWLFWLLFGTWIVTMILIPFAIGGIAVATPFLPGLAAWFKTVTLYDFFTIPAFWYAILMSLIGILIGFDRDERKSPPRTIWLFTVAGVVIFLLLIIGRFLL